MSGKIPKVRRHRLQARIFAALGDETRLLLVLKLGAGQPQSIARLTEGSHLTRQAVTKHLRVLEEAGLVRGEWAGREYRYELEPEPFQDIEEYLAWVSKQWDQALLRLKGFVEK